MKALRLAGMLILLIAPTAGTADEKDLEPYLETGLEKLVAQIKAEKTSYPVKRRAMLRILRRHPKAAPDALVQFLYHPGASLNEYTAKLLFRLGRPHGRTDELIGKIREGRTEWTQEQIVAFAEAISWPGNTKALPTLTLMVDKSWDTSLEALLCSARIKGTRSLLELPAYGQAGSRGLKFEERVTSLLRSTRPEGLDLDALLTAWEGRGIYGAAWRGNEALAKAYLAAETPTPRLVIAAVRTRHAECLKRIRERFAVGAKAYLGAKEAEQLSGMTAFDWWTLTAGVEAATDAETETLARLLRLTEKMRADRIAQLRKIVAKPGGFRKRYITDPGAALRETIFRGLCITPNRKARELLAPYLDRGSTSYLAGLALLRAGDPDGLRVLLCEWTIADRAKEAYLLYTGRTARTENEARMWIAKPGRYAALQPRIARVNASPLVDDLIRPLLPWP